MQPLLSVWTALDGRRKIIVVGATIAMFAAVLGLSKFAATPNMSLLYAGLDPAAAGDVLAELEQQSIRYEIRHGAIYVDSTSRDGLRMTLAAAGLPANNSQGYELLDGLSGFGTTSQMFDAAYWRAKEGELARTISSAQNIKAARVHISNPSSNPFQRDLKPSASVSVTTQSGPLGSDHAEALRYLIASAVAGLGPEDVSIIDTQGGLINAMNDGEFQSVNGSDRAAEMRRNIQRILEARVGPGNSVVEVNIETITQREAIIERRLDPDNRVAVSSESEELSNSSNGTTSGAVTVASNLPEGDAAGGENSSRSENSETRERVDYDVSETTREIIRAPGAIRRLSIAVLVDGVRTPNPDTGLDTWEPRSKEELESLRELVASAVGFDADRGDQLTIKSLQFESVETVFPDESGSLLSLGEIDLMQIVQVAVLALVTLILGLFVIRPILSQKTAQASPALSGPSDFAALPGANIGGNDIAAANVQGADFASQQVPIVGDIPSIDVQTRRIETAGQNIADSLTPNVATNIESFSGDGIEELPLAVNDMDAAFGSNISDEEAVDRLRQLIQERRDETVEILRGWMEDDREPA